MLWNKDFNSFLVLLFARAAQPERLHSLLQQENLSVKELAEYLEHYADADYCISALADIQSPETSDLICQLYVEALNHGYTQIKWIAENSLKYLAHRNLELVRPYLSNPSARVRSDFCELLNQLGNPDAIPALLPLLDDESEDVRYAAIDAIEHLLNQTPRKDVVLLDPQQLATKILEYMKNMKNTRDAQALAALALCKLGDVDYIMMAFRDEDKNVRLATARAMNYLYSEKAIPGFLEALNDSEWFIRKKAVMNLAIIGDKHIIPDLLKLKEDDSEEVRISLILALVEIAKLDALPYLPHFTNDSSPKIRRYLLQSIQQLKHPAALSIAEAMLHDSDLQVQSYAQMTIKWLQTK